MSTAREGLLDALEELLIQEGERAATLDAVAARAGVSKGGLLYHFASKAALVDGLVARMQERAELDVRAMRDAPDGPAAYYVRTSAEVGSAFDHTLLAAFRLAPGSDSRVTAAIQGIRSRWLELITNEVGDGDLALAILLMGDGLYYSASLALDSPADVLQRLTGPGLPGQRAPRHLDAGTGRRTGAGPVGHRLTAAGRLPHARWVRPGLSRPTSDTPGWSGANPDAMIGISPGLSRSGTG